MLTVKCEERLEEVRAFADRVGLRLQLERALKYLALYGAIEEYDEDDMPVGREDYSECELYTDFAPHSFAFAMFRTTEHGRKYWFNGGLIYQGPDQPADGGMPSLTVSMSPTEKGWFVHT